MILNNRFDKIFVINLKESIDRKNHILKEFKNFGITNFEFFEATHFDDLSVKELMKSNKVFKFPPCFRCLKERCDCKNNFLTKYQIANWVSYINLFKHILNSDHNFVLICEDDIVFTKHAHSIFNKLLSKMSFNKHQILLQQPLLIKMAAAFDHINHNLFNNQIYYTKNYALSNPCFAVNKPMIKLFLDNLKIIDYHSDVYFHKTIPRYFQNNMQMFVMRPLPVFELSFVESYKKFDSLVRPNNSIRRKEFKEFLFFTITEKLEYIPLKFSNKYNFKISNSEMDFNGNINSYFNLNNNEKKKYFFKEKIAFFDSYENDIHHIIHQLTNDKNNYLHKVINDTIYHYKLNIKLKIDNENELKNDLKNIYPKLISYLETLQFKIININDDETSQNKLFLSFVDHN
jgi:GR25 family glycosyltransferase involved in LPS biosynthesis